MALRPTSDQAIPANRQRARTAHLCTLSMAPEPTGYPSRGGVDSAS